mmetsp:Transcript_2360/g.9134  ORF Transcript_2360/g.9134 Transcript_2360/m.9134 type:complete len:126 (+) Transcript_2360:827-1204(+)
MRRLDTRRDAILALVIPARARLLFDKSGVEWRARAPPPPVTTYKKQERAAPAVKFAALASVVHAHVTRGSCIKLAVSPVSKEVPQKEKEVSQFSMMKKNVYQGYLVSRVRSSSPAPGSKKSRYCF